MSARPASASTCRSYPQLSGSRSLRISWELLEVHGSLNNNLGLSGGPGALVLQVVCVGGGGPPAGRPGPPGAAQYSAAQCVQYSTGCAGRGCTRGRCSCSPHWRTGTRTPAGRVPHTPACSPLRPPPQTLNTTSTAASKYCRDCQPSLARPVTASPPPARRSKLSRRPAPAGRLSRSRQCGGRCCRPVRPPPLPCWCPAGSRRTHRSQPGRRDSPGWPGTCRSYYQ